MPFCEEKALRVKRFIETYCSFSKGEWAGQPFILLPWQWDDIIKPLFGTVNDDGYRQYRNCYVEIPKKNGKSELCAAVGLYMLTNDGEEGAEVYLAAADIQQAGIVYQAAATMVSNSPDLTRHIKRLDARRRLVFKKKNSFMQVLSSESYTKHGLSPSAVIIDEIHAHPNGELYEVLTAGTDYARRQQIVLVITTAGIYDKESIWWKLRTRAQQVKAGTIEDHRLLPVLYLADLEKDDPEDEELWKRVNPSLGQIFTLDKIRQDYNEAKQNPIDFQNFKRFRLNIPIRQLSKWMPMDKWDSCAGPVDLESLKGRKCYGGLDLSSKIDLAAFVLVFPPDDRDGIFDVIWKIYCPEEGIIKRSQVDRVNYDIWQKEGFLIATPGNVIDYAFIEKDIFEAAENYQLGEIGYDSWNAQATATRIMEKLNPANAEHGFQMVEMRQGAKTFNEPAKDLLVKIMTGKVRHGGNPVARWNADNLVMRADANGNVAPDKLKATDKIDGLVALMMAWGRAMFKEEEISVYENLDVESIKKRMML
jgi:phage terminase large subunit-like protein